ncbi:MAG: hypothetical protein J0H15_03285 [Xanthomonadales bacterium]|nr:hypothetical protein [Xanthomonadales bacterium]
MAGLAAATLVAVPRTAHAEPVFTVDSTLDQIDADPGDGVCATAAGTCTLRAAIMQANRVSGIGATIRVPSGVYTLTRPRTAAGGELDGDLDITTQASGQPFIRIIGDGSASTIIDANQIDRVLTIQPWRVVTLQGLTLRNGHVDGDGGAIESLGHLTLHDVAVQGSRARGSGGCLFASATLDITSSRIIDCESEWYGGGIFAYAGITMESSAVNASTATMGGGLTIVGAPAWIRNSRFRGNSASYGGGAIQSAAPSLWIGDSTLSENESGSEGGGIFVGANGSLRLERSAVIGNAGLKGGGLYVGTGASAVVVNSTLGRNVADRDGGAVENDGTIRFHNSTLSFNHADPGGQDLGRGGGLNATGPAYARNTILAGNLRGAEEPNDCHGVVRTYGRTLFGTSADCALDAVSGTVEALSPGSLGTLGNHGGRTATVPLLAGSNAIDSGDLDGGCHDDAAPLDRDQRGYERVGVCDIGAFEYGAFDPDEIFRHGFE